MAICNSMDFSMMTKLPEDTPRDVELSGKIERKEHNYYLSFIPSFCALYIQSFARCEFFASPNPRS